MRIGKNKLKTINLTLIAVYVLVLFLMLFIEIGRRRDEIISGVDHRLYAAAYVVKYLFAEDFHDRAIGPGRIGMNEERINRHRINTFRNQNGFEWVYTVVEWGGGYYFSAPSVTELEVLERESWYFYPYEEIPREFIEAFNTGEPVALTYRDSWGVHRSVAVPEKSPLGNVYIACVDYNISAVDSEVTQGIITSGLRFAVIGLIVIPFLFLNIIYNIRMNRLNVELNDYRHSLEHLVTERTSELMQARDKLREQAIRDSLTGIYNRRYMSERLEEEMGRHLRSHSKLTMMMIDLDHFKEVNDCYGHIAGDRVLINITNAIREHLREHDIFGRYGGDEFIILLPDTDLGNARRVGEKLLTVIKEMNNQFSGQKVTLSIGAAEFIPGEDIHELLARADFRMYEAKKTRNTVFS